jgi:hypothetical protein
MDRTFSGDFHQARPLVFGHVSLDGDVAGDLADSAVRPSFRDPNGSEHGSCGAPAYREGIDLKLLSLGAKAHRHRRTGTGRGEEIIVRSGPGILSANRDRFVRNQLMTPGAYALRQVTRGLLADLDHAIR